MYEGKGGGGIMPPSLFRANQHNFSICLSIRVDQHVMDVLIFKSKKIVDYMLIIHNNHDHNVGLNK